MSAEHLQNGCYTFQLAGRFAGRASTSEAFGVAYPTSMIASRPVEDVVVARIRAVTGSSLTRPQLRRTAPQTVGEQIGSYGVSLGEL